MRFIVPMHDETNLLALHKAGADGIILQHEAISPRLVSSYDKESMESIIATCQEHNIDVFLHLNVMMHQTHIPVVKDFLVFAKEQNIDGIIFGDIGVYQLAKDLDIHKKLYFQPGTLTTNVYDAKFWHENNIKGMFAAREITTTDIVTIAKESPIETAIIGHGHLNMFHSKRPLITNFLAYQKDERPELFNNYDMTIIEAKRDAKLPIFENTHGTHVFRAKPMHSFDSINQLKDVLDLFMIDSIFKSDQYTIDVLTDYHQVLNDPSTLPEIKKRYHETHDTGFLDRSTVYDTF